MTPLFKLKFPESKISYWANRYSYPSDDLVGKEIAPRVKKRGYLTRAEFVAICKWKTPRSQPLVQKNPADLVEVVTRAALESSHENVKIGVLRILKGVSFPTASVLLHFFDRRLYPILDVRALWSLGYKKPPRYTFEFWMEYTRFTRRLAKRTKQSMRSIDRALWQYSKEHQ